MKQFQLINSLRIYSRVVENKILIELPKNFNFQEVEVIIIPKKENFLSYDKIDKDEWKKDFLSVSKWDISEDEIRVKSWSVTEF